MGPIWSRSNAPQHSHWLKCNHSLYEPYNYSYKLRNTPWRYSKAVWCSNIIITPTGIDRLKDYHLKNEYFIWDWCVNTLLKWIHSADQIIYHSWVTTNTINTFCHWATHVKNIKRYSNRVACTASYRCKTDRSISFRSMILHLNPLRPRQNGRHFPDDIFKCIFVNDDVWIAIKISLKFVTKV